MAGRERIRGGAGGSVFMVVGCKVLEGWERVEGRAFMEIACEVLEDEWRVQGEGVHERIVRGYL